MKKIFLAIISILLLTSGLIKNLSLAQNTNYTIPEMVLVEGGTFKMGSKAGPLNEQPIHKVKLDSFYISKYEITNKQFCEFLNFYKTTTVPSGEFSGKKMFYIENSHIKKNGTTWKAQSGYENYPVSNVTWYGANEYCNWLSHVTGENYRLPTEAEWEFAAKGGVKSKHYKYSGTSRIDLLCRYANYCDKNCAFSWKDKKFDDGYKDLAPVGKFRPNELGLHDMSGNVMEWVWDWYKADYYAKSPFENPTGPMSGKYKVYRGGSFINTSEDLRCANRDYDKPDVYFGNLGFRIVKDIKN